jgi:acetyl-CoA synthetase
VFWSPADWAWTGGLMDALLPALYFGKPIVGYQGRFTAETAFYLLDKYKVTNTFLFPTALKMMMKAVPAPRDKYRLKLRAIMSAGEAVGDTVFHWCEKALKVTPNEMFGQTEMNYIVGNSHQQWPAKPGSMGRPYPGHRVAVIDDDGHEVSTGETGEVAVNRYDIHGHPDPVFFSATGKTMKRPVINLPATGAVPVIWRCATMMATSGIRGVPTICLKPPVTESARLK